MSRKDYPTFNLNLSQMWQKYKMPLLGAVFLLSSVSWVFVATLNRRLSLGPNLISAYESTGMPNATIFRFFDLLAALVLIATVAYRLVVSKKQKNTPHMPNWFWLSILLIGILTIVDVFIPINCTVIHHICTPTWTISTYIHASESVISGTLIFILSTYYAFKLKKLWWVVALQIVSVGSGNLLQTHLTPFLLTLQFVHQLVNYYWIYLVVFYDNNKLNIYARQTNKIPRLAVSLLVALGGLFSIWLGLTNHLLSFVQNSTQLINFDVNWLVRHSVITGLILIVLSRQLYRGSRRAWSILVFIVIIEFLKVTTLIPSIRLTIVYGAVLSILLIFRHDFSKFTGHVALRQRLLNALTGLTVIIILILVWSVGFKLNHPRVWENSAFSAGRVVKRALLLEIRPDKKDPRSARVLSEIISISGGAGYIYIFLSLFAGGKREYTPVSTSELLAKLELYSSSSEDPYKIWPKDKQYFTAQNGLYIAYTIYRSVVLALANPIGPQNQYAITIQEFTAYCRSNGLICCWLMVEDKYLNYYVDSGLKNLSIGSSAIIDSKNFKEQTAANKWWRWVINKNLKSGLSYHVYEPPLSQNVLDQISTISDQWLREGNHKERTFALGYFDKQQLSTQKLHVLKNNYGELVCFANELSQASHINTATIDLMRSRKDYQGTMAFLISQIILNLPPTKPYFDLGFVPLTQNTNTSKVYISLIKALNPIYSVHGLMQFKNKFQPSWQQNYIAWDGDLLELPKIARAISKKTATPKIALNKLPR